MKNLLLLSALFLVGCSTISAGPSYVHSNKLGYVPDYYGGRVEATGDMNFFTGKLVGAAYDSKKLETGDGFGYRLSALGGYRFSYNIIVMAGLEFKYQRTSTWVKQGFAPAVEVQLLDNYGKYIVGASRLNEPDDHQTVVYGEYRVPWSLPFFLRYEYVDYKTLFAEGEGNRYEIGLLIPILSRL